MAIKGRRRGSREREREDYERRHHDREGKDHPVFVEIIRERWLGSDPPTAQAYARALAQWRQLPGAIATSATDLGDAASVAPPAPAQGGTKDEVP